jgi:hypothetical protein
MPRKVAYLITAIALTPFLFVFLIGMLMMLRPSQKNTMANSRKTRKIQSYEIASWLNNHQAALEKYVPNCLDYKSAMVVTYDNDSMLITSASDTVSGCELATNGMSILWLHQGDLKEALDKPLRYKLEPSDSLKYKIIAQFIDTNTHSLSLVSASNSEMRYCFTMPVAANIFTILWKGFPRDPYINLVFSGDSLREIYHGF